MLMISTFSLLINEWELKFFQFSEDKGLCSVVIKSLSDVSSSCDVGLCVHRMRQKKKQMLSSVVSDIWEATQLKRIQFDFNVAM